MSGVVSVGVAAGAAAFAATDIAAAGLTIGTALEATAALGAAVGAVGAVTHNKALTIAAWALAWSAASERWRQALVFSARRQEAPLSSVPARAM